MKTITQNPRSLSLVLSLAVIAAFCFFTMRTSAKYYYEKRAKEVPGTGVAAKHDHASQSLSID
jgi:hypothetical protein